MSWTAKDDELLLNHVLSHGTSNYGIAPDQLRSRFAVKEMRERWRNVVNPELNHGPWSPDEDATLVAEVERVGKKWAKIKELLPGRSATMLKKRWHELDAGKGGAAPAPLGRKRKQPAGEDEAAPVVAAAKVEEEEEEEELMGTNDDDAELKKMRMSLPPRPQLDGPAEEWQADNSSASSEDVRGIFEAEQEFPDFPTRGLTPYQGHVVSMLSPFVAGGHVFNFPLQTSPGIMRNRQLFSPSITEMTPVRSTDFREFNSPSVAAFFQTPARRVDMPWMTPQKKETNVVSSAAPSNHVAPPRPTIAPVNQSFRRRIAAINQKIQDPGQPHTSTPSTSATTLNSGLSAFMSPLQALPPVTLFNGVTETHPAEAALAMLRRNDQHALFEQAAKCLEKSAAEDVATKDLLTVASAALDDRGPQSAIEEIFSPLGAAMG